MNLSSYYKRQYSWRAWPTIYDALPSLAGQIILDVGCGVGDQAADLVARGARVIGIDTNEEALKEAQSRNLANAEFKFHDLRTPLNPGVQVDGLWISFAAAYFPDLPAALALWATNLRPGGWVALIEIDDLFGHEPLSASTKSLFDGYARDALAAGRYDFHMGRKLRNHLERSGFTISKELTVEDQEFSFKGPAHPDVIDAWRMRLDWMKLLRYFCGADFEKLREDFLGTLARADHRSNAKVYCCIATKSNVDS